jgi:hypothetical protein
VDLTGHHSNPPEPLGALLEGRLNVGVDTMGRSCDAAEACSPIGSRHRRHDWVLDAVIRVLADRSEAMRARDIHRAVEALLGEPVRWGSVKQCLSSNVAGTTPRFVRVARGRYAADVRATNPGSS